MKTGIKTWHTYTKRNQEIMVFLYFLLALLTYANGETIEIHSPRTTNWGHWYDWSYCPEGMLAYAMQVKVEPDQRGRDDTGLNAVSLYCNHNGWSNYNKDHWIMSGEGPWGDWKGVKYCPEGQLIVGFALRSEPDQRGNDDVAADNFAAYCGYPDGPRNRDVWIEGDTPGWGGWTADQWCPQGFAVCGIRSQIEEDQRGGDDTALNNVDLKCCRVSYSGGGGSCVFEPQMVAVAEYDNRQGAGRVTAEYYKKISFSHTTGSTNTVSQQEKNTLMNKVNTGVTISGSGVFKGINLSGSASVNHEWSQSSETMSSSQLQNMVQDVMTHERSVKETFEVPPWTKVTIEQLFIVCGTTRVGLAKTISRSN